MPGTKVKVTYQYPATVDLGTININCRNGILIQGESAGDFFGASLSGGNVFNTTNSAAVTGALGYPSGGNKGRGYIIGGPLKSCPPSGIVPISSGSAYFRNFVTVDGLSANQQFTFSTSVGKITSNPGEADSILWGSSGTSFGGVATLIRGGTWLQTVNSVNIASPDGVKVCNLGPFFGAAADGCGFVVKITNGTLAIGCPYAFSNLGAVVIVSTITPNFCAGGTINSTQLDGVKATYYKGVIPGGQLGGKLDVFNSNTGTPILGMSGLGVAYYKALPTIMGPAPILVSVAENKANSTINTGAYLRVGNLGDIFQQGSDVFATGDPFDSTYASNAGRTDILFNSTFLSSNLNVPNGITSSTGTTIFDTVAGESLGYNSGTFGDSFADNATDYYLTTYLKSVTPYGTRTNAGAFAACYGGAAARSALQGNRTTLYQDLIDGVTCTEYEGAVANDQISNLISISSIGPWDANNTVLDIGAGSYTRSSNTGFVYLIWGHKPPQWQPGSNAITVTDCQRTTLSRSNFLSTNPSNNDNTTYIYNVNATAGGYFALSGSTTPLPTTNSFNDSLLVSGQVQAVSDCSHIPFAHTAGITVPGYPGSLPPQTGTDTFVRTFPPVIGNNQLRIGYCQTVLATPQNFGVSSVYSPLLQNINNVWLNATSTHLNILNGRLNNQTVSGFQIFDLANSQIYIADDCSPYTIPNSPAMNRTLLMKATDDVGLFSTSQTSVNFIPGPLLVNTTLPLMSQGGTIQLGTANLGAITGDSTVNPTSIQYSVAAQHAVWADPNPQTLSSFYTQQDLINRVVYLVNDGTDNQPFVNITLTDPVNRISFGPTNLAVPFVSTPSMQQTAPIISLQDRTTIISNQILGTQRYNVTDRGNLQLNVTCDHAQIPTAQPNLFKNSDLTAGVPFFTDDSGIKSTCTATISDGIRFSASNPLVLEYHPTPMWDPILLTIKQGQKNQVIPSSTFNLTNLFYDPATYVIDLPVCQRLNFSLPGIPNAANCTIADVQLGKLTYSHDDTVAPVCLPFNVTEKFGPYTGVTVSQPAQFNFIKRPQVVNKTITYYEGDAFAVTTDMFDATCDAPCATNASSLVYSLNPSSIALTRADLVSPFNTFSKQDELNSQVYLVSNASTDAPASISGVVTDTANGLSSPFAATVNYFSMPAVQQTMPVYSVQNQAMLVSTNQLLALQQYNATDLSNLYLNISCQHANFSSISQPSIVNLITNGRLFGNDIQFFTDNSGFRPVCTATASDGKRISTPKPLSIDYHPLPIWSPIQPQFKQGLTFQPFPSNAFNLTNLIYDPATYTISIPACQHLNISLAGNPAPQNFTFADVQMGKLLYSHDNSLLTPSCPPFKVTDKFGLVALQNAQFPNLIKRPQVVNKTVTYYEGDAFAVTTDMFDATCDAPCAMNASSLVYSLNPSSIALTRPDLVSSFNTFSKQDELNSQVYLVSNASTDAPGSISGVVTDTANGLSSPFAATVNYFSMPSVQQTMPVYSVQNQAVLVSTNQLLALQQYNATDLSNLYLNISCQHANFSSISQPSVVNLVSNRRLFGNDIQLFTDNSGFGPVCTATASDGKRISTPKPLSIDYHPLPIWSPIQPQFKQGLTSQPFPNNAFNLTNLIYDPATYTISIPACQHLNISLVGNPAPQNFTFADVQMGKLLYSHDNSLLTPSCPPFKVTDKFGLVALQNAQFPNLIKRPQVVNKTVTYYEGDAFAVTTDMFDTTCDAPCATNASSLWYSLNPQSVALTHPDKLMPFNSFSKNDQLNAQVYLVSNPNTDIPGIISGTVTDTANGLSSPFAATVNYFSMPSIQQTFPIFSVQNQGSVVPASQLLGVQQYNATDLNNLFLNMSCQHAYFDSISQPSIVNLASNSRLFGNDIQIFADNSGITANCSATVSDGKRTSKPIPLSVTLHSAPQWTQKPLQFKVAQGVTNRPVPSNTFPVSNIFGDPATYTINLPTCQHLSFSLSGVGTTASCSIADLQQNKLVYSNDGLLPSCGSFVVIDNTYGLSDSSTATFSMISKPQPINNTLVPLYQTGSRSSFQLTTSMLDWSCAAPCGGNSSALQYSFNPKFISVTRPDLATPLNIVTRQDVLYGQVWIQSSGTNNQPILDYNVTDLANDLTTSSSLTIPFRDVPVLTQPSPLTVDQNACTPINWSKLFLKDNTSPSNSLGLTFTGTQFGSFYSNATGVLQRLTTPFALQQGSLNPQTSLFFCDANSGGNTDYFSVFGSNAWFNTSIATVPVTVNVKNPPCKVQNILLSVSQDSTNSFPVTAGSISFAPDPTDIRTTFGQITVNINYADMPSGGYPAGVYPKGGYFLDANDPSTILFQYPESLYTQTPQYPFGQIAYKPDGNTPNFQLSCTTPAGVSNIGGPITVSLATPYLQWTPSTAAPTVDQCLFVLPEGEYVPLTRTSNAAPGTARAVLQMSSKFGDQNAIQALITNNQRIKFYNNATGSFVQLPNPVSFIAEDYAVKGNIWVKSDNAYLTDTDINFYVAANNGNRGNSQPCSTQSIHVPAPSIFDNTGGNIYVTAGGSTYITDSVLKSHNRDATLTPTTLWNITGGGACHYQYDIFGSQPLASFPNSAIGTSGAPAHLQVFHDGSLDANGRPNPCTFNYTLITQPDGLTTGPVTSSINVIPSASSVVTGGGTSFSLLSGSATTSGIIIGVVLIVGSFTVKYIIPKVLDSYFEREINDPLELAILQNMNKRLTLASNWCDWNSKDKKDKFGIAVQAIISHMAALQIQTRTNIVLNKASCSGCCNSNAAEKKAGNEDVRISTGASVASMGLAIDNKDSGALKEKLLDQLDINSLAKIVVTKIKSICISKRGGCTKCKDRCCCRRDVEDETILNRAPDIAQAVYKVLESRKSHIIKNLDALPEDMSRTPQLQSSLKAIKKEQAIIRAMLEENMEIQREIAAREVTVIHYNDKVTRIYFGRNSFGAKKFSNDLRIVGYNPRLNLTDSTKNVANAVVGAATSVIGATSAVVGVRVDIPTPSMLRPEKGSTTNKLIETEDRRWVVELSTDDFASKGKSYLISKDYEITDEHDEAFSAPVIKPFNPEQHLASKGVVAAAPLAAAALSFGDNEPRDGHRKEREFGASASATSMPLSLPASSPAAVAAIDPSINGGDGVEMSRLAGVNVIEVPQPASLTAASPTSATGMPLLMPRTFNDSSAIPQYVPPPPPVLAFSSAASHVATLSAKSADEWAPPPPPPPSEHAVLAFSSAGALAATASANDSGTANPTSVHLDLSLA